jgi:hypothetical protein
MKRIKEKEDQEFKMWINQPGSNQVLDFFLVFVIFTFCFGNPGMGQDVRKLIYHNRMQENAIKTSFSRVKMITCKFKIQGKKIRCTEQPRVKILESIFKNYSNIGKNGKQDRKSMSTIISPKAEKGIGMLNYSYQSDEKDDDIWMYFSSLGKVRRITSSNKNDDEPASGSLFGSEFSSEDINGTPIDDYKYKIIKSIQYKGNETWVIEQIPNAKRLRKSSYSKKLIWMDQDRKIISKWVTYNRQGKPFKLFNKDRWNLKDGIWMADLTSVKNLITRRKTTIITLKEILNVPIENENYFSQRVLTDEVFQDQLFKNMHQLVN